MVYIIFHISHIFISPGVDTDYDYTNMDPYDDLSPCTGMCYIKYLQRLAQEIKDKEDKVVEYTQGNVRYLMFHQGPSQCLQIGTELMSTFFVIQKNKV